MSLKQGDNLEMVQDLLRDQYGLELEDVDETAVYKMIVDGEEPQEIVDWVAEKFDLVKLE